LKLDNKWALVTGSARRVGKEIVNALSQNGCNIFLHYGRSEESAKSTAKEIENNGSEVILVQADLKESQKIDQLFESIKSSGNTLDITVNSAASFLKKPVQKIESNDWDLVQDINLKAPFLIAQRSASLMAENTGKEKGNIIFIADLSGVFPWKGYSVHGVSKAGIVHLTKSLAFEFAPDIRVNGVIPGLILPPADLKSTDDRWRSMMENIPLKRDGNPKHVSQTILFLLKNDFMTGNLIYIDGGEHLVGNINHLG
jgi:pteridine reductase